MLWICCGAMTIFNLVPLDIQEAVWKRGRILGPFSLSSTRDAPRHWHWRKWHIINTSVFCNHGGIHVLLNRHIASIEPRCLSTEAPSCFFVVPKNKPWYGCNSRIVIYANEDSSAHYICIVTTMPVLPSFVSSREHLKMHTMTASHVDKSIGTG